MDGNFDEFGSIPCDYLTSRRVRCGLAFKYDHAATGTHARSHARWSLMGRRTLVAVARPNGCYDCRIAHWGVDADPIAQSRPLGNDWTAAAVLAALDATYEQLVLLDGSVRTYAVCWLDPTLSDLNDIVLARVADPDAFRTWWVERKDDACRALDSGGCDPATVRRALLASLQDRTSSVYCPDDASFLRGDR
ncbi:DUF6735 family protein [Haloarcula sp. CBA1127]|uniref:DUF6735 family protein n=1 Tax=Haloarcula sp. CBA1127 TaxID=1765055 RepID=UPI001E453C17|nr:hypothetical protein [Haloarcula sp. CBA1127]